MTNSDMVRSPFENVFNFLGGLPEGHEKPLKNALYNSLALLLLLVSSAAGWALYIILGPFLRPLLWALMCGSVLHPFKHSLATKFRRWITALESSGSPFVVWLIVLPINLTNDVSELIGNQFTKYLKSLCGIVLSVLCLLIIYNYTPHICICLGWQTVLVLNSALQWIINNSSTAVVLTVVIAYLVVVTLLWQPDLSRRFEYASWPVWFILSCYFANLIGTLQVPMFILIQLILVAGCLLDYGRILEPKVAKGQGKQTSLFDSLKKAFTNADTTDLLPVKGETEDHQKPKENYLAENTDAPAVPTEIKSTLEEESGMETPSRENVPIDNKRPNDFDIQPRTVLSPHLQSAGSQSTNRTLRDGNHGLHRDSMLSSDAVQDLPNSDKFIYGVMWACLAMLVFNHLWPLYFVPVPIFIYIFKHTGHYFGIWHLLGVQIELLVNFVMEWCKPRKLVLFPVQLHSLSKLLLELRSKFLETLKYSVDSAASIVVVCGVIVLTICTTIFIAVQVYAEGMHVIQIGANVVNSTLVSNSEFFSQIVPVDWYSKMDSVLGNAYLQGRQGISDMVHHWLVDVDKTKAAHLEKQALDLWDRIYQSWMMSGTESNFVGPTVTPGAVWDNFVDGFQKAPDFIHFDGLLDFAKTNMDSLMSVLQTVWSISKGNISLVLHSLTAIISVVFGGGTAVLNLLINTVVFFTALFYLLSSSGALYKPVDLITNFSPIYGNRFAVALETALTGVFKASFKMALFYGLWTWLIHNIFRMKIVYLPSVLAALLAAVPFLGTYWACIPAVLELWLAQNSGMQAILLFICQFLPTYVVDTIFYQEIESGGHPYLTGLSIAGGIFCLGAEGAIIGPVVLCGLFVILNLSSTLMMDSPTDAKRISEPNKLRMRTISRLQLGEAQRVV